MRGQLGRYVVDWRRRTLVNVCDAVSSRVLVLDSGESPSVKRTCPALSWRMFGTRTRLVTASHTFTLFRYPSVITLRRRPGVSCRPSRRFRAKVSTRGVGTYRSMASVSACSLGCFRSGGASVSAHRSTRVPVVGPAVTRSTKSCWVIPHSEARHMCSSSATAQASLCPANSAADPRVPVVDSPRIDRSTDSE